MNLLKKHRWILLLIIFSAILRFFIYLQVMNTTPFSDYFVYKQWVYRSYSKGFKNLYSVKNLEKTKENKVDQPPGTILIMRGSYEVFLQTARVLTHFMHLKAGATLWINDNLLIFFLRLPSILADLLLGFFIYALVKTKTNEKIALISSAFYLLSPPIIYNSTVWGQIDSINNLFFYISLLFLVKKKAFPSILFYALSLFVKLSFLPLVPLYLLLALFGGFFKRTSFAISLVATSLILLLLSLPFSTNPFWLIDVSLMASSGQSQDITINAFNFWWLIFSPAIRTNPPDVNAVYLGLKLVTWGNMLFTLFYLPVILCVWRLIKKKKLTIEIVYLCFSLVAFATFLFLPRMHERYLYPVFPLLITWVAFKNKYWITTAFLSIIHFINLYVVWNPNLFLFGTFENVIQSQTSKWLLSLVTIVIFGFFYLKLFPDFKSPFKLRYSFHLNNLWHSLRE